MAFLRGEIQPMAYIIDGNNVRGQTVGWHRDKPGARRNLVEKLAILARRKKARVTVVFDGRPDAGMPDASAYRGVRVLYAEPGSDADTRIERLVESSVDRRGLTVVTSDRRIAAAVRGSGAVTMRSGAFRTLMDECLATTPQGEGFAEGENYELDDVNAWLRYFGALPEDSEK